MKQIETRAQNQERVAFRMEFGSAGWNRAN